MKITKITDRFGDYLEVESGSVGLTVTAANPKRNQYIGFFLDDVAEVRKLRDALNEYLQEPTISRPISFGGGGNNVIIVGDKVSQFSSKEAETLKKLVQGLIEKAR